MIQDFQTWLCALEDSIVKILIVACCAEPRDNRGFPKVTQCLDFTYHPGFQDSASKYRQLLGISSILYGLRHSFTISRYQRLCRISKSDYRCFLDFTEVNSGPYSCPRLARYVSSLYLPYRIGTSLSRMRPVFDIIFRLRSIPLSP